jgi:Rv2525c-like, glycoside hydrolase-like domain
MRAWRAKFSVAGVYIGGEEMACGYGNLSAAWVRAVKALGWSLMPTYVGPQAPCDTFSGKINLKRAAAQGRLNAQWAIRDAAMFGMGKGSPIYYDMEAYDNTKSRCVNAVLEFLDGWTRQINEEGYISGVYSSAGSAVTDLANNTKVAGHPLAEPQALWFALWDNASDLNGTPYLPGGRLPLVRRSKQFAGSHWVKIGHFGLDIDSDFVNSAVVR